MSYSLGITHSVSSDMVQSTQVVKKKGGCLNEYIITRCIAHATHSFADYIFQSNQFHYSLILKNRAE